MNFLTQLGIEFLLFLHNITHQFGFFLELLAQLGRLAVVVEAETKRHTVDVEEVHKLG